MTTTATATTATPITTTSASPPSDLLAQGQQHLAKLAENPQDAASYAALGEIALLSNAYTDAVVFLGRAIQIAGPETIYCQMLAEAFLKSGKRPLALASLEQALTRATSSAPLHKSLAQLYYLEGHNEKAAEHYHAYLHLEPADAEAWFDYGVLCTMANRLDQAQAAYQQATEKLPLFPKAWNNLALLEHARGSHLEAEKAYRHALMADPNYRDALYNFALLLQQQERLLEAIILYERLLSLHPDFAEAHNNLGNCYLKLNKVAQAKQHYAQTLSLQASHREAPWNLGFASLLEGDFRTGWLGYEYRLAQRDIGLRQWSAPRWDGSFTEGKRILVHSEQGLGDTLQFARYLHQLTHAGMRVDVLCQAPLVPLLGRINRLATCGSDLKAIPPGDWQASFPSLPGLVGTRLENIPAEVPYLSVDPQLVREWRELFRNLPASFQIGFVWQGNPKHKNDHNRSLPAALLAEVFTVPGCHFSSLQKGVPPESIPSTLTDLGRWFRHFGDTAAAILNLDLVISVDTSVAHLAGALGKPVWILLPYAPDWRWMLDREDSPWYPSARLFRQPLPGDWPSVIRQVRNALHLLLDG
ncbi:MAG: tetratricopeptide repeat protein [Bryobacter sp.]|nr:tetratricopeptide repeat protein [Bryobacter sp.]